MDHRTCTYPGCEKPLAKRGWCGMHYERWRKHGDPSVTMLPRDKPSYLSVHKRLARRRGPAKSYPCAAGCGSQAKQWAYDHTDPNPQVGPMRIRDKVFMLTYSLDFSRYMPLCVPCHAKLDR